MQFFKFFPQIQYGDDLLTNLLVRGKIRDYVLSQNSVYYSYVIQDGERPDTLASKYYGNSNFTWIIFYANDIFDPLYQWPLEPENFGNFIIKKYGSIEKAQSLSEPPHHYLLDDQYIIDETTYLNNTIPANRKKAVSNYDYEVSVNEAKRSIKLIDSVYVRQITNELKNLFK